MVCFDFKKHERQFLGDGSDGVESAPMTNTMTPSEIEPALDLVADLGMKLIATQKKLKIATEALEPLANMAAVVGKGGDDSVYVGQSGHRLTFGDFRRAAEALARIKEVGA